MTNVMLVKHQIIHSETIFHNEIYRSGLALWFEYRTRVSEVGAHQIIDTRYRANSGSVAKGVEWLVNVN